MSQQYATIPFRASCTLFAVAFALLWSSLSLLAWDDGVTNAGVAPDAPGRLSGTIRDVRGAPVTDTTVALYSNTHLRTAHQKTQTDIRGVYTFTLLPAGYYRVALEDHSARYAFPQYYQNAATLDATPSIPVAGTAVTGVDMTLQTGGRIRGRVTGLNDEPLVNINVQALRNGQASGAHATTDGDGVYEISNLGHADYVLKFEDGTGPYLTRYYTDAVYSFDAVPIAMAPETVVEPVNMVLPRGGSIQGQVIGSDGKPVGDAHIHIRSSYFSSEERWVTTAADGTYAVHQLQSGNYTLTFANMRQRYISEERTVAVVTGEVVELNVELAHNGVIRGTVANREGDPLPRIEVAVTAVDNPSYSEAFRTGADGMYEVRLYVPGSYRLTFKDWRRQHMGEEMEVMVGANETVTGADVVLDRYGRFQGRVTTHDGQPLAGVRVRALRPADSLYNSSPLTYTNAQGNYVLIGVPTEPVYMEFYKPDSLTARAFYSNAQTYETATLITAPVDTVVDVDATLGRGGVITGTVTWAPEAITQTVWVEALQVNAPITRAFAAAVAVAPTQTTYLLGGLAPGEYLIHARKGGADEYYDNVADRANATRVRVEPDAYTRNIDFVLGDNADYAALGGTVRGPDGQPVTDVRVTLYREIAALTQHGLPMVAGGISDDANRWDYVASLSTDEAGRYRWSGLLPGTYRLRLSPPRDSEYALEYYADAATLVAARDIVLAAGQILDNVDATVGFGGTVTGTVTAVGGTALFNGSVVFQRWDGLRWEDDYFSERDYLRDGHYRVTRLPSGRYRIRIVGELNGESFTYFYGGGTDPSTASEVMITAGQTISGLHMVIPPDVLFNRAITGTVVTEQGRPAVGMDVALHRASSPYDRIFYTATNSQGHYQILGLRAGRYFVRVSDPNGTYATAYSGEATTWSAAGWHGAIRLEESTVISNVNVMLRPGGAIRGRVTSDLQGLAGIHIVPYRNEGDHWTVTHPDQISEATGDYAITGLVPGTYRLQFEDPSYTYERQYYGGRPNDSEAAAHIVVVAGSTTSSIDVMLQPYASRMMRAYLPLVAR